jgi:hypothetical protein
VLNLKCSFLKSKLNQTSSVSLNSAFSSKLPKRSPLSLSKFGLNDLLNINPDISFRIRLISQPIFSAIFFNDNFWFFSISKSIKY